MAEDGEDGLNTAMISEEASPLFIPDDPSIDARHSGAEDDDGILSVSIDSDELVL